MKNSPDRERKSRDGPRGVMEVSSISLSSGRRRLVAVLVAAVAAALTSMALPTRAEAMHLTCTVGVYAPVKAKYTFANVYYVHFRAYANCASGTPGRLYHIAQRHRWYGWQDLYKQDAALDSTGYRFLGVPLDCPGPTITPGVWTFRSYAFVNVAHLNGFQSVGGAGPERRYNCE